VSVPGGKPLTHGTGDRFTCSFAIADSFEARFPALPRAAHRIPHPCLCVVFIKIVGPDPGACSATSVDLLISEGSSFFHATPTIPFYDTIRWILTSGSTATRYACASFWSYLGIALLMMLPQQEHFSLCHCIMPQAQGVPSGSS
jgi:hypothetical protein